MECASVGKVVKHKSMLSGSSYLREIGVEPNFRIYEPCREHKGDLPLSSSDSWFVCLMPVLFDVDQRGVKLARLYRQSPQVVRSGVYPLRWYLRKELGKPTAINGTIDGVLLICITNIPCCFGCCWVSIELVEHTVPNMNFFSSILFETK